MPRAQFTAAQEEKAELPGFPIVRGFADSQVGRIATEPAKIVPQKELVFLALSGGGADGAFGAGILNGWTETKQWPEFTIVSGVSTGALMAPFAFLGPAYDSVIKEIYTGGYAEQFVKAAHVTNVVFGAGLISAGSANSIASRFIDAHLLDEVARQHRKGRRPPWQVWLICWSGTHLQRPWHRSAAPSGCVPERRGNWRIIAEFTRAGRGSGRSGLASGAAGGGQG